MKTRVLNRIFFAAALAVIPATAGVIVGVSVSGPDGSEAASGEFPSHAWGTAATGSTFIPNASVQEGLPPCCLDSVGPVKAAARARVDATKGLAGASAIANHPSEGESARAEAYGAITDTIVFSLVSGPLVTINMDLSGSTFFHVTGDAEGSYRLVMEVFLDGDDPKNPDTDLLGYFGTISLSRDLDGTRYWSIGSTISGFTEGTGDPPPLHFSETFVLPDNARGIPLDLFLQVYAAAECTEGTGSCSISAEAFDTGYLGITGDYTSTHSYPGLQPTAAVPEPHTFALIGMGLAALFGASFRRRLLHLARNSFCCRTLVVTAAVALVTAFQPPPAGASLLSYDGFGLGGGSADYLAGNDGTGTNVLGGQNPATGPTAFYGGGWVRSGGDSQAVKDIGSLAYPMFPQSGGQANETIQFDCCSFGRSGLPIAGGLGGGPVASTIYQSFLISFGTQGTDDATEFGFRGYEMWDGGVGDTFKTLSLFVNHFEGVNELTLRLDTPSGTQSQAVGGGGLTLSALAGVHLVVLRFDFDPGLPGGDRVLLYLDPTDSIESNYTPAASILVGGSARPSIGGRDSWLC